jgi:transposase
MTRNQKIMDMINNGATYAETAKAIGVTRSTVAGVVYRERRKGEYVLTPTSNDDLPPIAGPVKRKSIMQRIINLFR